MNVMDRSSGRPPTAQKKNALSNNADSFDKENVRFSEESITPELLQYLSGAKDLSSVEYIELQVDAAEQPVELIGHYLKELKQLRLSSSFVPVLRNLGTELSNLKILWLCRAGVSDLSGLSAMPYIEELYLSFNKIYDLYPMRISSKLIILDIEGNDVTDETEFLNISIGCKSTLRSLTVSSNPVMNSNFNKNNLLKILPNLAYLDDEPVGNSSYSSNSRHETDIFEGSDQVTPFPFDEDINNDILFINKTDDNDTEMKKKKKSIIKDARFSSLLNFESVKLSERLTNMAKSVIDCLEEETSRPVTADSIIEDASEIDLIVESVKFRPTTAIGGGSSCRPQTALKIRPPSARPYSAISRSKTATDDSSDGFSDLTQAGVLAGSPLTVIRSARRARNAPLGLLDTNITENYSIRALINRYKPNHFVDR
eukprot:GHVL01040099.1.p1 GENE.GHVL01040099.1~~GHVL01040099.1.p1  ORF type:complete len:427 (-),score=112.80 GHVL01040099.1:617-1897(-)